MKGELWLSLYQTVDAKGGFHGDKWEWIIMNEINKDAYGQLPGLYTSLHTGCQQSVDQSGRSLGKNKFDGERCYIVM